MRRHQGGGSWGRHGRVAPSLGVAPNLPRPMCKSLCHLSSGLFGGFLEVFCLGAVVPKDFTHAALWSGPPVGEEELACPWPGKEPTRAHRSPQFWVCGFGLRGRHSAGRGSVRNGVCPLSQLCPRRREHLLNEWERKRRLPPFSLTLSLLSGWAESSAAGSLSQATRER